jgi:hypothetical protein
LLAQESPAATAPARRLLATSLRWTNLKESRKTSAARKSVTGTNPNRRWRSGMVAVVAPR